MVKIIWAPKSLMDLEVTSEYIAKDSEEYAELFAKRVFYFVETIPLFPYSGRVVSELKNDLVREKLIQSHRIIYRLHEEYIEIVRIVHVARNFYNIDQ